MNILPFETRVKTIACLLEGLSIRSTERLVGINRNSIMKLGIDAGEACQQFHNLWVRNLRPLLIEVDELWSYCSKKQINKKPEDPVDSGDQWIFIAMDSISKLVISFLVDKRSVLATREFISDLRSRVLGKPQITTDGYIPYQEAMEDLFGGECDYAMLVKNFQSGPKHESQRRYSSGKLKDLDIKTLIGNPDKRHISTSHVERLNLTLRMNMRRFTRLTNAYSKKLRNMKAAVALNFAHYNFCRVHESLRVTPAMQARITDHVWSLPELVEEILYKEAETA